MGVGLEKLALALERVKLLLWFPSTFGNYRKVTVSLKTSRFAIFGQITPGETLIILIVVIIIISAI